MKRTVLLAVLALSAGGCATHTAKSGPSVADTIAAAQQAVDSAHQAHVDLWLKTAAYVKEAKQLQAAGKSEEAMKLAQKALDEVHMAEQQAQADASAGPSYLP